MGMGNLQYTVTFYPQACLVHINLAPLVVTLVHKDGQPTAGHGEPNFGDSLAMVPEISEALEPLRRQARNDVRLCLLYVFSSLLITAQSNPDILIFYATCIGQHYE